MEKIRSRAARTSTKLADDTLLGFISRIKKSKTASLLVVVVFHLLLEFCHTEWHSNNKSRSLFGKNSPFHNVEAC